VTIPATKTQAGNPISAITLTGQLSNQMTNTSNIVFQAKTGTEFNVINNTISCSYDTQPANNYVYGQGTAITQTGSTDLFKYFKFSDCKTTTRSINCSN
jgi:hypothetical protein